MLLAATLLSFLCCLPIVGGCASVFAEDGTSASLGTTADGALRAPVMLPIARSTLAPPASSTFSPGWCAWTAATAFSAGTTALSSLPGLPATLKVTSAERPPF